jgi:hypothetical protein
MPAALGFGENVNLTVTGQAAELVVRLMDAPLMDAPGVCEVGKPAKLNVGGRGALAGLTVKAETGYAAVCGVEALSFTDTVNEKAPGVVGVPEMTPLVAFNVNPPGSAPELIE